MSRSEENKQKGKAFIKTSFYWKLLWQIFLSLWGKMFPGLSSFKGNFKRKKQIGQTSAVLVFRFLSLGTAKGWSWTFTWASARWAGGSLLTSASTSFFLMPSEESSRFCSFSSSLSARSLAWRIFCSSSVASVLAFTAFSSFSWSSWILSCCSALIYN